jgi:hypothetical protein
MPLTEESSFERHLLRVNDPAPMSLLQRVYVDRNKLRAELNMLKSMSVLQIDQANGKAFKRYGADASSHRRGSDRVGVPGVATRGVRRVSMRGGMARRIARGVFDESGRKVFDIGFTRAIRKVLGSVGTQKR